MSREFYPHCQKKKEQKQNATYLDSTLEVSKHTMTKGDTEKDNLIKLPGKLKQNNEKSNCMPFIKGKPDSQLA